MLFLRHLLQKKGTWNRPNLSKRSLLETHLVILNPEENFEYQRSLFCECPGLSKIETFWGVWMTKINTLNMNTDNKAQTDISLHPCQKQRRRTEHSCCCVLVTCSNTRWCRVFFAWCNSLLLVLMIIPNKQRLTTLAGRKTVLLELNQV